VSWLFRSDVEFHVSHDVVWIHGTAISQTAPRLQVNQVRVYTDAGNFLAFNVGAEAGIREHSPHKKKSLGIDFRAIKERVIRLCTVALSKTRTETRN